MGRRVDGAQVKLLQPSADLVGLALYFEPTLSAEEFELEGKLILDKRALRLTD